MSGDSIDAHRRSEARLAGLLYLTYLVLFPLSTWIQGKSVVWADGAATARAMLASEEMFRLGIVTELVSALIFLLTAWALYVVFRHVNRSLALLFLLLNLVGVAMECVHTLIHFGALLVLDGAVYGQAFRPDQLQALALLFLRVGASGSMADVLFYGAWLFPLGYLVIRSRLVPRVLGILLLLDGIALLICFLQMWLLPSFQKWTYPLYPVMFLAECGLGLWLAIRGIKTLPA